MTDTPTFPRCPIRGHDHELALVRVHVQQGTGDRAWMLECPTGNYRFFFLPRVWAELGRMARFKRPRWGWPST